MSKKWIFMIIFALLAACDQSIPAPTPTEAPSDKQAEIATIFQTPTLTSSFTPTVTSTMTLTPTPTDTATPVIADSPTSTPSSTPTDFASSTPKHGLVFTPSIGECTITAIGTVAMFSRPSGRADLYGYLNPGNSRVANAYTLDGFIGFDAGVRHIQDIGIFRERWVWINAPLKMEGNCQYLEVVVGPMPGVCYAVAGNDTRIYRTATTDSDLEATMHYGDYVKAIGRKGNWVEVDSSVGNLYLYRIGWIMSNQFIPNGPCSSLHIKP